MNNQEFVDVLKKVVVETSIEAVKSNISKPAGRKPQQKYLTMSSWYNGMSESDKIVVDMIVKESVETTVFGFLCVLDGVAAIEDDEIKGRLELYYEKNGIKQLLNDPDREYLHDLFNQE